MQKIGVQLVLVISLLSCEQLEPKAMGTVVFGANFHSIDCITDVHVFMDGTHMGKIEMPCDSLTNCTANFGVLSKIGVGKHSYLVKITTESGHGCTAEIEGDLWIEEGACEKVFINYADIEWN